MKTILVIELNDKNSEIDYDEVTHITYDIRDWLNYLKKNPKINIIIGLNKKEIHIDLYPCILELDLTKIKIENLLNSKYISRYSLKEIIFEPALLPIKEQDEILAISENWQTDTALTTILSQYKLEKDATEKTLLVALRRVSADGNIDHLRIILNYTNAHINARDENIKKRRTALHWAVDKAKSDIVETLLMNGASIEIPDADNLTPFDYASAKKTNKEIVILLTPKNYLYSYEKFRSLLLHESTIPLSFINILYHRFNQTFINNKLRQEKLELCLKHRLVIKIVTAKNEKEQTKKGEYFAKENEIVFYYDNCLIFSNELQRAIAHELEHAYKALIHRLRKEKNPYEKSHPSLEQSGILLPFFPPVKSELHRMKFMFAKGDESILFEFYDLLLKEAEENILNEEEQLKLSNYKNALANYKPALAKIRLGYDHIGSEELQKVTVQEKINNKTHKFKIYLPHKVIRDIPFYIEKVEAKSNVIIAYGYYADDVDDTTQKLYAFIFETAMRRVSIGPDYPKYARQAEHHARIMGELPHEVVECFYPELLEYDKKDADIALDRHDSKSSIPPPYFR